MTTHSAQASHVGVGGEGDSTHTQDFPSTSSFPLQSNRSQSDFIPQSLQDDGYNDEAAFEQMSLESLLTPEYSTENQLSEQTTPQEQIWEQQFLTQDTVEPQILDSSSNKTIDSSPDPKHIARDLQSLFSRNEGSEPLKFISGNQLMSPRPTNTPSTPGSTYMIPHSRLEVRQQPNTVVGQTNRKRDLESVKYDSEQQAHQWEYLGHNENATLGGPQKSIPRSISPIVTISIHKRGDSPARVDYPMMRSSSKRSNGSDKKDLAMGHETAQTRFKAEQDATDEITSRLVPPNPFENTLVPAEPTERHGVDPSGRGDDQISSINELSEQRERDEKNAEVENWLATSETGSDAGNESPKHTTSRNRVRADRLRSRSAATRPDALGIPVFSDRHIPGPGLLLDETSADEYTDDASTRSSRSVGSDILPGTPPVPIDVINTKHNDSDQFPAFEEVPTEQQEPLPRQFYRRVPWQDPIPFTNVNDTRDQPVTSNAAITRWRQEASKWDSASRAATWGTGRRLSESEVKSIVDGSQVRHLSLAKKSRERGGSLLTKARGLIPRRSNSNVNKPRETLTVATQIERSVPKHRESVSSIKSVQRKSSSGKPKSPSLNTGSALMAMTNHLTVIGGGGASMNAESETSKFPLQALRKHRSKSDVSKAASKSAPGLAELMTRHGGPPMPMLASPTQEREPSLSFGESPTKATVDGNDDHLMNETGIKMDLSVRSDHILPTLEGFKTHVRQLNPRLEPYLIDRIGQEQLRRYKRLMEIKVKHTRAVRIARKCPSGRFCFDLGGDALLLTPRISARDPEAHGSQFQVTNTDDVEIDESTFTEGAVTPALFPPGIPLPPVKRLPAEFECSLCFKVKKFQKPSDWTKHVHEDIQPFSCTFAHCTEPKSFKRKADWVRHENERHRRLEFWKCNVQDCNHLCYRKDNFVQHLVREHKKVEPKIKARGPTSLQARSAEGDSHEVDVGEQDGSEVLRLVEACRSETPRKPRDEPCKFCGNVCNTWKLLSVHMGKHMEQISMPVLDLVGRRQVSPETIISPVEQNPQQQNPTTTMPTTTMEGFRSNSLSPYAMSAESVYQGSSVGHSPIAPHTRLPEESMQYDTSYYNTYGLQAPRQSSNYPSDGFVPSGYPSGEAVDNQSFVQSNGQSLGPYHVNVTRGPVHYSSGNTSQSQPIEGQYYTVHNRTTSGGFYNDSQPIYRNIAPDTPYIDPNISSLPTNGPPISNGNIYRPGPSRNVVTQPMMPEYLYESSMMSNGGSNHQY